MLTTHGDDTYRYKNIRLNFSSNICNSTDLSGLKTYLAENLDVISSYPEPEAYTLETMIAERIGVDRSCVLVTNGATEAIYLLAQAFRGRKVATALTTFREYEQACRINDAVFNDFPCEVSWECNPNNPTGDVTEKERVLKGLKRNWEIFHIFDHAYEDYTLEPLISDREAVYMGNAAIIHSMTKQYGVPGLRLGYVVTNNDMAERLRAIKQPWSVNALALKAGEYLLIHGKRPDAAALTAEAQRLRDRLNEISKYIMAWPSKTNFMLCDVEKGTAAELKDFLARKYGMLIRDASDFPYLDKSSFRVAVQGRDADDELVEAIRDYDSSR